MKVEDSVIAFKLNQTYHQGIGQMELYDITRHSWRVSERREKAKYAFAVFHGIVKEIYKIAAWLPQNSTLNTKEFAADADLSINTKRWEFVGNIAEDNIREKYLGRDISGCFKSNQSPFEYINC